MIETSPSSFRRWIRSRISAPSLAPIAASGSSSSRMSASECTVRATAIACRCPPERRATGDVQARDVDPDLVERRARLPAHRAVGQERQRPADPLAAQEHVLEHRQLVDQREVLVDGVDAERARMVDAARLVRLAAQEHAALVGLLEAADDLHQRRLAGAVVAEQPQHLALAQVQVDVAQRDDRARSACVTCSTRRTSSGAPLGRPRARPRCPAQPTPTPSGRARRTCWPPSR